MFEKEKQRLVTQLIDQGYIKTDEIKQGFLKVPREEFIPNSMKDFSYVDTPLDIGNGQTISAPHMVVIMCEALDIKKGQKILEIGTGSGYHAAIVAQLVGRTGQVYTIERFESLAKKAKKNLEQTGCTNVIVEVGDGSCGLPEYQPYDRIYVTCAAPCVPQPLIDQLQDPGKLLIPVGNMYCELTLLEKTEGHTIAQHLGGCVFVPLVGKYGH
ncbi:protein-L-isoaspartate O-methyltransferase [Thermoplasmatales archaeon SM1-50]|nr:MAG: protein-L-isoaspartate O-methyltransferase [Thermoplasmatales archaeon SM1-50]